MKQIYFIFKADKDNYTCATKKMDKKKCKIIKALSNKESKDYNCKFAYQVQFKNGLILTVSKENLIPYKISKISPVKIKAKKILLFIIYSKIDRCLFGEYKNWYLFNKKIKTRLFCMYSYK